MAILNSTNFPTGVTVTIVTTNGTYIGELISLVDNFVAVRLTAATAPFFIGQVIRINTDRIVAFG
ncbi:hypothetical protein Dtox_3538 [Desulfofarcimen acetoxidans DSM 771]|jgi:hypothetical protein|uniref:Uncharacterized protein n=1 Tax=Desulfofarcimen acetoxidans (strain ATCC 49208 / DSM 771 / KCTC 5769 / VKM B-1644 / 5575) TaxID=485916 RepID=C8VVW7_DESAS|nr:hypothetical protein [Desulfofarcimen acetoxidans]ACV64254.1 hypothetical protein Dtox_3538 [Desulfofarcimen acetoxidans DSM 771]